jgi:16S rRNA processing protein RimM
MPEAAWLTLGRVVRVHGRRGEVAAEILTDFPRRLLALEEVSLASSDDRRRLARVLACRLSPSRGGQAIFQFAGVASIEQARLLVGLEIQVPISERLPLPPGAFYTSDLIGCEVWEGAEKLGRVRGVETVGTPVLAVETPAGELLVPLASEICRTIDLPGRRIEVVLPEGLRELNRESRPRRRRRR